MSSIALCIPAYNAAWSLPKLFASVKQQAICFDEVLLYDDCSTDETAQIAISYGAKVIHGTVNRGCSYGKNQLAANAKSEWLFFLDSDDELLPEFTASLLNAFAENPAVEMFLLGYIYSNAENGKVLHIPNYNIAELKQDQVAFMIKNKIVNSSAIKRDCFIKMHGFDIDSKTLYVEDRAYSIKCAIAGLKIDVLKENIFKINYYPKSMSSERPEKWLDASLNLWRKIYRETGTKYALCICDQLFQNALWSCRHGKWSIAQKSLTLAKMISPTATPESSDLFTWLFKINRFGTFWLREMILRLRGKKNGE